MHMVMVIKYLKIYLNACSLIQFTNYCSPLLFHFGMHWSVSRGFWVTKYVILLSPIKMLTLSSVSDTDAGHFLIF